MSGSAEWPPDNSGCIQSQAAPDSVDGAIQHPDGDKRLLVKPHTCYDSCVHSPSIQETTVMSVVSEQKRHGGRVHNHFLEVMW